MNKNNTRKSLRSTILPHLATVLVLLMVSNAAQAEDNKISIPRNPLMAGFNVNPNVLVAFDDSGSMVFEVLFKSQGALYWDDGSFIENGNLRSSGTMYTTLFPHTGYGINTYKNTIPPVEQFAFTRSPQFNMEYFSPTVEYKPWPGDYVDYRSDSADLTSVRYVPEGVNSQNDYTINLTESIYTIFDRSNDMPKSADPYKACYEWGWRRICDKHYDKYHFYPATFYLTGKSKKMLGRKPALTSLATN